MALWLYGFSFFRTYIFMDFFIELIISILSFMGIFVFYGQNISLKCKCHSQQFFF